MTAGTASMTAYPMARSTRRSYAGHWITGDASPGLGGPAVAQDWLVEELDQLPAAGHGLQRNAMKTAC